MTASLLTTTTAPILTESMPLVMCVEYMANHAMTTGTMGGLRRLGWCTLLWAPNLPYQHRSGCGRIRLGALLDMATGSMVGLRRRGWCTLLWSTNLPYQHRSGCGRISLGTMHRLWAGLSHRPTSIWCTGEIMRFLLSTTIGSSALQPSMTTWL